MTPDPPTRILVTGASSGIGAALARAYAAPGIRLSLWGRDAARLAAVAAEARALGAEAREVVLDLADATAAIRSAEAEDDVGRFDLAILAAGLGGMRGAGETTQAAELAMQVCAVNLTAPVALATCLARRMAARGVGTLVLVGSAAAFVPLPQAPAYSASKAGLGMFAAALRLAVAPHGVRITLVSPGYVDTPMSRALGRRLAFLISAEAAAARIVLAVSQRRRHVVFPWPFALLPLLARLTPGFVQRRVLTRLDRHAM